MQCRRSAALRQRRDLRQHNLQAVFDRIDIFSDGTHPVGMISFFDILQFFPCIVGEESHIFFSKGFKSLNRGSDWKSNIVVISIIRSFVLVGYLLPIMHIIEATHKK